MKNASQVTEEKRIQVARYMNALCAHLKTHSLVFCCVDADTTQLITDQVHQLHNHSPPSLQLWSQNSTLTQEKDLFAQIAASLMMCFCSVTASPSSNCLSSHNFTGCCSLETVCTPDDWWALATIKGVLLQTYELLFSSVHRLKNYPLLFAIHNPKNPKDVTHWAKRVLKQFFVF